jgi:hypothetical protein
MLRKLLALSSAVAMLAFAAGCQDKGTKKTEAGTGRISGVVTIDKPSLELSPPADVTIKPGGEATVTFKVTRKNTSDELTAKFSGLPDGVKVKEADTAIPGGKEEGKFTLVADANAKETKDKVATVTVAPERGTLTAKTTFKVTVAK